jgi:O-antigen ligase
MPEQALLMSAKLSRLRSSSCSSCALIGTFIYIFSLAIPLKFEWDIPLFTLALFSIVSTCYNFRNISIPHSPLIIYMSAFLVAMAVAIFFSKNLEQSVRLSASFLPGVLLFFLIAIHFNSFKDIFLLYFTFSIVSLLIAYTLLCAVWLNKGMDPAGWLLIAGSPYLLVKNDVTLLAVIAPFSMALLYQKPQKIVRIIAALSIFLSIIVIGTFQSRVAMLTLIISLSCFFALVRPKNGLICGIVILILVLCMDGFMGFPLVERFIKHWDGAGRIPLWLSAFSMFLDSPLIGYGPHTFVLFYNSYLHGFSLPSWLFVDPRIVPWPHNLYLEVLAEQGIIGLTTFMLLLVSCLRTAWNLRTTSCHETRVFGYGVFAGLVGFCFAAFFELTFLRHWVVIIMFVLIGASMQLAYLQKERTSKVL